LTNQLIQAQTNLYNAQFTMTTIWITYLNTRDQIYRDMELMPLDSRGSWIDDTAKCMCPPAAGDASKVKPGEQPAAEEPRGPEPFPKKETSEPLQLPVPRPAPQPPKTPGNPQTPDKEPSAAEVSPPPELSPVPPGDPLPPIN
jgi:hypothetical protein